MQQLGLRGEEWSNPQNESFLFHFNKIDWGEILLCPSGPQPKEVAFLPPWISAHWQLQDGSAGPAAQACALVIIPPDEFSWGICSLNAKLSGQDKWKMHYMWHAVSPRNVFRYVHRQWDKAVPLSHSCCWNCLLEACFCISSGYLQWNIGVSCLHYVLKYNKLKS